MGLLSLFPRNRLHLNAPALVFKRRYGVPVTGVRLNWSETSHHPQQRMYRTLVRQWPRAA